MKKILAKTNDKYHGDEGISLECCLCGENDRNKLLVEAIGIGTGMAGQEYSFCEKCWRSENLGQKILDHLEYPNGMKIKNECLEIREVEI